MTAAAYAGVCPRVFVTPWAASVLAASSWWERGQLGASYLTAPAWLASAFGIIARERNAAASWVRESRRKD